MLKGIFIGIFIYSFINTIFIIYKDKSTYFIVENIDIIIAGPICWLFLLIFNIIAKFIAIPDKEYKTKNSDYISKITKKIVKIYKKNNNTDEDIFYFQQSLYDSDWNICGWQNLLVPNYKYEHINNKFKDLMYYQSEQVISELKKYFIALTNDYFDRNWRINPYKSKYEKNTLYSIKGEKYNE